MLTHFVTEAPAQIRNTLEHDRTLTKVRIGVKRRFPFSLEINEVPIKRKHTINTLAAQQQPQLPGANPLNQPPHTDNKEKDE